MKLILLTLCAAMGLSACGSDNTPSQLAGQSQLTGDSTPPAQGSTPDEPTGNAFFNAVSQMTTTSSDTTEPMNIDVVGGVSFQETEPPTSDTTEPEPIPAS